MKRLIAACILLLFIIVIGCVGSFTVLNTVKNYKNKIEDCEKLYSNGDTKNAQKTADNFKKEWYETTKRISLFTNHRTLDDISILSGTLAEAAKEKNDFDFYSAAESIKTELNLIYKEQSFNIESLY